MGVVSFRLPARRTCLARKRLPEVCAGLCNECKIPKRQSLIRFVRSVHGSSWPVNRLSHYHNLRDGWTRDSGSC